MFCTIREIQTKKSRKGKSKTINVWTSSINGLVSYHYNYSYTDKFIRPPKPSYEISIQHSYRENGKVKKKRWKIATINYYDFVDGWANWYDGIRESEWDGVLEDMCLSFDELGKMIDDKLTPITELIEGEYHQTEEYKTHIKHERITTLHIANKMQFEEQWGV